MSGELDLARRAAANVLAVDSGGCGACMQSIEALQATRYAKALRARGITFVSSPRHADIVVVTGALSARSREPIQRVLAAVPQPYAVVAVGNCAVDGCVFSGSAVLTEHPADELGAHVEIAGCPPTPEQVLAAIERAQLILGGATDADDADDAEDIDDAESSDEQFDDEVDEVDEVDEALPEETEEESDR